MKTNKIQVLVLFLFCTIEALAQTKVVTYYDPITRIHIAESYTTSSAPPYLKHGVYEKFDAYGALMERGTYNQGKKNGTFTNYFSTEMTGIYGKAALGKVWSITNYVNDKENGVDKMFTVRNGQQILIKQYTWSMGKKIKDEEWNEDGKQTKLIQPNGPCFEYYSNGNKKTEYTGKNEKMEGKYTSWYPSGQVEVTTNYVDDLENGNHIEYFQDGKPELEAMYVKGKMSGIVTLYFEDGKKRKEILYDPSTFKLVYEKEYSRKEILKFERKVISGDRTKSLTYDSISGVIIEEIEEEFIPERSKYVKNGKAINYYASAKIKEEATFINGILIGSYKKLDEDGQILRSGSYDSGIPVGEWLYHYTVDWELADSKSKAAYFRRIKYNSPQGPWETVDYYITGEKQFQGFLLKLQPEIQAGKCIYYSKSGNVTQELELDLSGEFKSQKNYYENGKLEKEAIPARTQYGQGVELTEYSPDGKIKAKGKMFDGAKVGVWIYNDENGTSRQVVER